MNKFPEVKTDRLLLSAITAADIPKIVEYAGNKKIADMTCHIPHPYKEEHAIFWINSIHQGFQSKSQYSFGMRTQTDKALIGAIGLQVNTCNNNAELGYWIGEPYWSKGYATEALGAILKFGFDSLELNKIYATYFTDNPASGRVLTKNGMIKEGELKDHVKKEDSYKSILQYRLTKGEYETIT